MFTIKLPSTLRLQPSVRLRLTPEQAASRAHVLAPVDKGVFDLTGETAFKAGETIGVGDLAVLPRDLRGLAKAPPPPKPKAPPLPPLSPPATDPPPPDDPPKDPA